MSHPLKTEYDFTQARPDLLTTFAAPACRPGSDLVVKITSDHEEFTCLCPLTGQPDFGKIEVEYSPDAQCVESKSLKLYLFSYRNVASFHEAVVSMIAGDLIDLLQPRFIKVRGIFSPRGGISFQPQVTWSAGDALFEKGGG